MYTIKKAEFMLCAAWSSQWPDESLPEVVMAGRSNVGKSSFINTVFAVRCLSSFLLLDDAVIDVITLME